MSGYIDIALNLLQNFKAVPALFVASFILRQSVVVLGQQWASTFAHSVTILLLPVTTYVITSAISGNIALSLGMVGALSIVRFRNPVKSPFELVVYFICITMGITASVSIFWLLLLCGSVAFVIVFVQFLNYLSKIFSGKAWVTYSFTEGNELSTITITSDAPINWLADHEAIVSIFSEMNVHEYRLASPDGKEISRLYDLTKDLAEVTSCKMQKVR